MVRLAEVVVLQVVVLMLMAAIMIANVAIIAKIKLVSVYCDVRIGGCDGDCDSGWMVVMVDGGGDGCDG